ncbi:MAG: BamA/TamA family outer membrane protein [Elusimicrobia bacterium]|nr:BamA/TamA family outer membrane protein [Elusimicrobiota bacterium]
MLAPPLLFLLLGAVPAAGQQLCPGIRLEGPRLALTEAERRMVCGDQSSEAWKNLPRTQVEGFLKAFLQQHAYHYPSFALEGGVLVVDPGAQTLVLRLSGEGLPPGIDLSKRRRVVGRPLTPKLLDQVKAALVMQLQNHGYACPEVTVSADARSGEVRLSYAHAIPYIVEEIEEPSLEGIDPGIFRRFEAFERGKPMDQRLLALSSERIVSEALFLNSLYDVSCGSEGVRLAHRVSSAPPRLVRIGIGVDTEGLARLRASWKHSRIGWRASSLQAVLNASSREQSLDALMRLYLRPASRWHLMPRAVAARVDDPRFETRSAEVSLMPAVTYDDQRVHGELRAGPAIQYSDTRRGVGPADSVFMTFNTHAELSSHPFEYFQRDPRRGSRADLDTASRVSEVSSELTAHRLRLSAQKLWNLGAYDPPLAVLGARGWIGTTLVGDRQAAVRELPPDFRFFLGGDADFRGVGRGELGDEQGFLTGAYGGLELRSGEVLPYRLQPLVFIDGAMAGRTSRHLDPDVHYAPGLGLRWATMIGALRTTLARGFLWRRAPGTRPPPPHWQFFFSYGREF